MKKIKNTLFYIITVGGFALLMYFFADLGKGVDKAVSVVRDGNSISHWDNFTATLKINMEHSLPLLLTQIVLIILFARIVGWLCRRIGQPSVIGEIVAGIALGPSLIGSYFPEFSHFFFPPESLPNLNLLSQFGLILFMFVVGMELDLKVLNKKANEALVISHTSIILPFGLGVVLAYFIYNEFAPDNVSFLPFALFMGIAMSITAFPVLARIVQERGLHKHKLGSVVITCAAIDDITAWCLLAVIIAIVKAGSFVSALYTIAFSIIYVLFMWKVVKPFLKRIGELHSTSETLSVQIVAIFFVTLLVSAWTTEVLGIHLLFGAFMAGVIMPDDKKFRHIFIQKVEDIALVLFLPLFFVYTGLRTEIGLLNDVHLWKVAGLILLVAVTGKFVGSALASKFVGMRWRDSLIIGSLMNTRGLMELVALNIGYDLGVLSPQIFAMMVIMALSTTFMTGPILSIIDKFSKEKEAPRSVNVKKFDILVAFANPKMGPVLLRIANGLVKKYFTHISVLHLSSENTLFHSSMDEYETESFKPVLEEAKTLSKPITTLFKLSSDVSADIAEMSNKGNYDLLLIGVGQSIFEGTLLGRVLGYTTNIINPDKLINTVTGKERLFGTNSFDDRTMQILNRCRIPVGIFLGKSFKKAEYVVLMVSNVSDVALLKYAQLLLANPFTQVVLFDVNGMIKRNSYFAETLKELEEEFPRRVTVSKDKSAELDWFKNQDLVIIGLEGWKKAIDNEELWIESTQNTLIIKY